MYPIRYKNVCPSATRILPLKLTNPPTWRIKHLLHFDISVPTYFLRTFLRTFAQWRSQGERGERTLPPEKGKVRRRKNCFGVKYLKTLKVGSLFVAVNSEPKIIDPTTLDLPTIESSGANIPLSLLLKRGERYFSLIKGWVAKFLVLSGEPKIALQNFRVKGSVLVEKMHTPDTKEYNFFLYRLQQAIFLYFHA